MRFTWILPLTTGLAAALTSWPAQSQPGDGLVSQEVSPRPQIATSEPTGRVAELIGRLANESPDQRQAAARSLLQMGLAVEPQVRWALQREEERHPALYPLLRTQSVRSVLDGVFAVSFYDGAGHELMLRRMTGPWMQLEAGQYEEAWAAKGIRMPEAGWEFHGVRHEGERDIASWRTLFSKRDRPETLLWRTPEDTRWLTVPFEFHDLKVPTSP